MAFFLHTMDDGGLVDQRFETQGERDEAKWKWLWENPGKQCWVTGVENNYLQNRPKRSKIKASTEDGVPCEQLKKPEPSRRPGERYLP